MRHSTIFFIVILQLSICSIGESQQQLNKEAKLGLSYVLSFKGVSDDLDLTDTQTEKLMGLWVKVKTDLERELRNYQANFSPRFSHGEREELKHELASKVDEIRRSELNRIKDVLLPQQLKRLTQIRFQFLKRDSDGLQTLVKELNLTPAQVIKIEKTKSTLRETILELRAYARQEQLTQNEITEEILDIREKTEKDLLEILSSSQRIKLKELEGEPFELQFGAPKESKR